MTEDTKPMKLANDPDTDRSWVVTLTDNAIVEILGVMHDMIDGYLRKALEDERWKRHAQPLAA